MLRTRCVNLATPGGCPVTKPNTPTEKLPLSGRRILVPPSRPEVNPLLRALALKGAEVVEFPRLVVAEPESWAPLDEAVAGIGLFDWLLFSGSFCVRHFFARMERAGADQATVFARKVAAVGYGALSALKERGVAADIYPRRHVAADVVAALEAAGPLIGQRFLGQRFLLVRVAGAPGGLPQLLRERGARVTEVAGYRMLTQAKEAAGALTPPPDIIAFANPAAVRLFARGLSELGLSIDAATRGVAVASVGPATTEAAEKAGFRVEVASAGSQVDLLKDLVKAYGLGRGPS